MKSLLRSFCCWCWPSRWQAVLGPSGRPVHLRILALSNIPGADQVQPKLLPLPNNSWYVSWFNNNPNDPPPQGYDVYYQILSANGVEQLPHNGVQVAKLSNSSTEDYGLAIDGNGNAILAFLDTRRDPNNQQVTAAKMSPTGQALWGPNGVPLTIGPASHNVPKVTVTTDGFIVVGWCRMTPSFCNGCAHPEFRCGLAIARSMSESRCGGRLQLHSCRPACRR